MDKENRTRFKALLLELPCWGRERERAALVADALWGHPIAHSFVAEGEPGTVAGELLDKCLGYDVPTEDGTAPLCAILAEIRARGLAVGRHAATVAALSRSLGCESKRPTWPHDPYPGLLALDHWQSPIFFGRAAETRELLRRLAATDQGQRFLLVAGVSGSGKSSLVRAGVWAALARGGAPQLPGSQHWLITAMFPAELGGDSFCALTTSLKQHPRLGWLYPAEESQRLKADPAAFPALLRRVLAGLPEGAEWLMILDQLEELFTPACADWRELFLDLLLGACDRSRFRVLATVRSDFLDRCLDHPGLLAVQNNGGQYGVRAPGAHALARMIAGPVQDLELAAPVELDQDLVGRMVDDAVTEPGGLALLAFALADLYDHRCRATGRMGLDDYLADGFGGLKGVIQRRADAAMGRAGEPGRAALPRVFSRLLTVAPDGTATRRREDRRHWAGDAAAQTLIDEFTRRDTRLLVCGPEGRPTLEVAHESLLREWPTLATWIADKREALRLRERVHEETGAWVRAGRPRVRLWRHELLDPARRLLAEADLLGYLESDVDIADFLTPEAEWLLAELLCGDAEHARREAIGMRLSEIEVTHPRPGVGAIDGVPDILWRQIPEGEVAILGQGVFKVAPFHMAAYPVTYAQYKVFLDAERGYQLDDWWYGIEKAESPGKQLRLYASYPADNVSWYDATAFCRWLSAALGFDVCLPSLSEWQWAAQSARRDCEFPWIGEPRGVLANTSESGIGRATAVGMYPDGRSLQGVYDLAGNVSEWCRNQRDNLPKVDSGIRESRVSRGGSWADRLDFAGAYGGRRDSPHDRRADRGFRVICAVPNR